MRRPSDHRISEFASRFGQALRLGSRAMAEQGIDDALLAGVTPAEIHTLVIEPAMVQVGELWQSGAISVAAEHLATAISYQVLPRLIEGLHTAAACSRERVVLAAIQGQRHELGLRMVADVLEGAGYDVLFLGGDVPLEALTGFVFANQPAVTGLGFTAAIDVSELWQVIRAVHEATAKPRIMVGGRAFPAGLRNRVYPFVRSSREVVCTVQALLEEAPQAAPKVGWTRRPAIGGFAHPGQASAPVLTRREVEVLQLSATGQPRRQIADELTLSEATVKTHLEHIYRKLGVHDRASAVGYGLRQGLIH